MKKITFEFIFKKRTEWSTFNEKQKNWELAKLIEACETKGKTSNSYMIGKVLVLYLLILKLIYTFLLMQKESSLN